MRRKMLSKVFVSLMTVSIVGTFGTSSVFANNLTKSSSSQTFDKAWELSAVSGNAKLKYGYNTTAINEDYAYGYQSKSVHYSYIRNGKGVFAGMVENRGYTYGIICQLFCNMVIILV